ncbi:kinesin-like protein KIF14 [Stomoxys calcitrans]|uniref:kinesin-like protein KIF14 n=1 Tax=Stomoxys calcitrans TaxID=35570 RepID=UPI0027E2E1D0|nr:kinesin-like protein KIF14 [Stomoxys calcitrans]
MNYYGKSKSESALKINENKYPKCLKKESTFTIANELCRKRANNGSDYSNKDGFNSPSVVKKTPSANACYTPSSLYRNVNTKYKCQRALNLEDTPLSKNSKVDQSNLDDDRLTVAVRVRPLNTKECQQARVKNVTKVNGNELTILMGTSADASCAVNHTFEYDQVFYSCDPEAKNFATQEDVYKGTAKPLIQRAFEGYNACLFAYGQTGSGKSYSMMGVETFLDPSSENGLHAEAGIIPRYCYDLFRHRDRNKGRYQVEIEVSFFEIYNEKIHDLLFVDQSEYNSNNGMKQQPASRGERKALKVREHPMWGPYVVDLSVHPVDSYEALRNWLILGNSQRASAATGLNDKSSRSHSIFNIMVSVSDVESNYSKDGQSYHSRKSKISLVDLAGSERTTNCSGERKKEGVMINKSLLTLGKVISALSNEKTSSGGGKTFVPYRESALTWLLRENLGGNSKTVMLATISPASNHIDDTLATLRYACQASRIVNRVKVNESQHDKTIRELRAEVERLKSLHYEYERKKRLSENMNSVPKAIIEKFAVNEAEMANLKEQLSEREKELQQAQKSWMDRLREAEDLRKTELLHLSRKGLTLQLFRDQKQACLVNLTEDPMLSETLFYLLPPGCVTIGRKRSTNNGIQPDIILDGPLIAHNHCTIENINGVLYVTPESKDFETYRNGELVSKRTQINHGDRLVFGGSHFYRVCNPQNTDKGCNELFDFRYACHEMLEKREEKIRLELENEKRLALSKIEADRYEYERSIKECREQIDLKKLVLKCDEEILDSERKINAEKAKKLSFADITPLKATSNMDNSNLLNEINSIMKTPSKVSRHKIQKMVHEANEHCMTHNLQLEFRLCYKTDEFGVMYLQIVISDMERNLEAEWPIARLQLWLNTMREQNIENPRDIFKFIDIEWKAVDAEHKSSEKFINDTPEKITLRKSNRSLSGDNKNVDSPEKFTLRKSNRRFTGENKTRNEITSPAYEGKNFETVAMSYLHEIENSAERLRELCTSHQNRLNSKNYEASAEVRESLRRVTSSMKCIFTFLGKDCP